MPKPTRQPSPPEHLSPEAREWFAAVVEGFELEAHHVRLLTLACESWDESRLARAAVAEHGQTFIDRYSQPRERPEVGIARQARTQFARLVRELGLDVEPPAETRPPRLGGAKH